jgi:hypothetical protein
MRGCYRDPWYGDIANEKKGDGLGVRFTHTPALTGNLEHWQQDTFVARWDDRSLLADAYITFFAQSRLYNRTRPDESRLTAHGLQLRPSGHGPEARCEKRGAILNPAFSPHRVVGCRQKCVQPLC